MCALNKTVNGQVVALSAEEEAAVKNEWLANENLRAAEAYKEKRKKAYGPIPDQLDMIYWDEVNGTTTWVDHISSIKAQFPKPA